MAQTINAPNMGLKHMRAGYTSAAKPTYQCPNCKCTRYNECKCMRKQGTK